MPLVRDEEAYPLLVSGPFCLHLSFNSTLSW